MSNTYDSVNECTQQISELLKLVLLIQGAWQSAMNLLGNWVIVVCSRQ